MTGAALLAARAALLSGGGRIYVGLLSETAPLLDPAQPELMLRHASDLHDQIDASCAVIGPGLGRSPQAAKRSEEHPSELQSLMRISYAVFCLQTKNKQHINDD